MNGRDNFSGAPDPLPGNSDTAADAGHPSRVGGPSWAQWLDGRKTYLIACVGALYVFGSTLGWWPLDERVMAILGFGGLAALRKGSAPPFP